MAVERLKRCENIVALSEELGVHRRLLYKWRDQLDPVDIGQQMAVPTAITRRCQGSETGKQKYGLARIPIDI